MTPFKTRFMILPGLALALACGGDVELETVAAAADRSPPPHIYMVAPSITDSGLPCPQGIGCESAWGPTARDDSHVLYVPADTPQSGNLLVFFGGGNSKPDTDSLHQIYAVAASQGYHVISLSYFTENDDVPNINSCSSQPLTCYGDFMREEIQGIDCGATCGGLNFEQHPQDIVVNRLVNALRWAARFHPDHGWERYLLRGSPAGIDWSRVALAGFSNGSSMASYMGTLYPDVRRVALWGGPNDGDMRAGVWKSAAYLAPVPGLTDVRYFGLVHVDNHGKGWQVIEAWTQLGMQGISYFNPEPDADRDFGTAHMLVSVDAATTEDEAHVSVVRDAYAGCDPAPGVDCRIGYEGAWRKILGAGGKGVVVP